MQRYLCLYIFLFGRSCFSPGEKKNYWIFAHSTQGSDISVSPFHHILQELWKMIDSARDILYLFTPLPPQLLGKTTTMYIVSYLFTSAISSKSNSVVTKKKLHSFFQPHLIIIINDVVFGPFFLFSLFVWWKNLKHWKLHLSGKEKKTCLMSIMMKMQIWIAMIKSVYWRITNHSSRAIFTCKSWMQWSEKMDRLLFFLQKTDWKATFFKTKCSYKKLFQ